VASVTGGGVTSWTKLVSFHDNSGRDIELWLGTVTTTGTSSIRVGYSASVGSSDVELVAQEFTAGLGSATLWAKDAAAGQNNASSTSIAYPSLTASGPGELYVGYARSPNSESAGSTPGFTYHQSYEANTVVFDPNVSGTAAPTATQSPAGTSAAVGALIKVSATSRPTPTVTSLSPVQGPSAGGTLVTVTGTNFAAGDTVDFGAVAASTVTVSSPTSLVATSPAGTGTVDVTVTSAGGTSAATAADHFAYQGSTTPTISAVGSLADADAAGVSSLSVQPVTGGDALVLSVKITSATASVASVTGGGVTSWTKL